jgi:hypothetical protein
VTIACRATLATIVFFAASCGAMGCSTRRKDPAPGDMIAREASAPVASAPHLEPDDAGVPPLAASDFVPATRRACRAKSLKGGARLTAGTGESPRPLAQGDLVPEAARIELDPDAELTLQATSSTREIAVHGPAMLEACPAGEEEIRLSVGRVSGFPGRGVRPGTDVWIATPLGVVRFNDAEIEVTVSGRRADHLEVTLTGGKAIWMPAHGVVTPDAPDAASFEEVAIPGSGHFSANRAASTGPKLLPDLVGACRQSADAAKQAAAEVLATANGDAAELGQRAFLHVRARQRARAACSVARAALTLKPGALDSKMLASLDAADQEWKGSEAPPSLTPLPARR